MSAGLLVFLGLLLLVLVASSALFSAIETALFALQPQHIERLKKRRESIGPALARLMENPRRLLSALLLADALVNLPLILLCLWLLREHPASTVPFWAAALLIFALIVFICDLLPKMLALAEGYRLAGLGVRVMGVLMPVVDPIARGLQRMSEKLAEILTPASLHPLPFLNEDELETLVELSAEGGALHETESEMIQEIIKLGDKTAKDCMTPRVDCFALPDDLTHEELIPKLRARRYGRVPIYGETPDDILGVLNVRQFLLDPSTPYQERLAPPSFVAETMKAIDLLRSFLSHPQGLAFVVDEHGGIEGLVTLADIVEEIISDAVPVAERALYIETLGEGELLANGSARLDDINELLSVELHEEGIDTIGGLIFNRLGALPRPGSELEIDGVRLTVRRTSRKRVEEVLIKQESAFPGRGRGGSVIWLAVGAGVLVSFIFSGIEAGILSVNRVRLKHRVKLRDSAALKLNRLLAQPERLLITVLVVTNLMNIFALTLATQELARWWGSRGYIIAGLVALPIYLLGLELLPKALFRRFPYRALAAMAGPLEIADLLLAPMHFVGHGIFGLLFKRRPAEQAKLFVGREDFKYLTIESEREGTLTRDERQMIHNVVDFRAITARDVMLPMEKVFAIPARAPISELIRRCEETNIDRWPVLGERGEIVGLVNVFDIALDGRRSGIVESYQRRIVKVAPNEPAYSVLRKMRAARTTLAAVTERGAQSLGVVTWEALVQRLVNTAVASEPGKATE